MKTKPKRTPWFARPQISCPDCGAIVKEADAPITSINPHNARVVPEKPFDCKRCKAHYTAKEFWADHHQKYGR